VQTYDFGHGLEPDASGAARVRMELGVRIVRTAFINTNTSDLSGRRGDRNHVSRTDNGLCLTVSRGYEVSHGETFANSFRRQT
jgi:hypothetical protein